jgi:hypothetical protein
MSIKYSKAVIDDKLQIKSYWSKKDKNKHVHQIFKKWNAKLRILKDPSKIQQAEYYLELCSQAMSIYKIKAKPRKLKKTVKPKPSVKIVYNKNLDKKKNVNKSPLEDWAEYTSKKIKKNKASDRIKPKKSNIQKIEKNYGILESFGQVFAYIIIFFAFLIVFVPIIFIPISNIFSDAATIFTMKNQEEPVLSENYDNVEKEWYVYTVKYGDTLKGISERYNAPLSNIRGYRTFKVVNSIYPEQKIELFTSYCNSCERLEDLLPEWRKEQDRKKIEALKLAAEKLALVNKFKTDEIIKKNKAKRLALIEAERLALIKKAIIDSYPNEAKDNKSNDRKRKRELEKRNIISNECEPEPYRFISSDKPPDLTEARSNTQPEIVQLVDLYDRSTYWNVYVESSELSRTKFKRHKSKVVVALSCFVNKEGKVSSVIFRSNTQKGAAKSTISDIEFNDAARGLVEQLSFEPGLKNREPICMWVSLKVVISKKR